MTSDNLATGTWASIDGNCPLHCAVEGSDLANVVIGGDNHSIELLFDSAGMRRLADLSVQAVADMDGRYEREGAEQAVTVGGASS